MAVSRQEKRRLDYKPPLFTITDVDLSFSLDLTKTRVVQKSKVKRLTPDLSQPLVLDGDGLKLLGVRINGQECSFAETAKSLTIPVSEKEFWLEVVTEISPENNTELMGLYVSDGKFCTQNEPEGFRRITYFLDRSDVLSRYTVHISAPAGLYPFMLSNGNLVSDVTGNGVRTVTWKDPFPKPSYLFALVAGDFDELSREFVTRSGKNVQVRLYVDRGMAAFGDTAIDSVLRAMKWDEDRFGLEYDLNRFNVVSVDFFNAGAMENKSLNIFNSRYVLVDPASATDTDYENVLSVIGHEYFHNWTGDRVTLRDWFQLSLKEGLTVFRDQEFSSDLGCRAIERLKAIRVIRGPQFAEDSGPMAHPVRPDYVMEMNNFYSATVYDKGAEVIRMIHTILGEEGFQKGMRLYISRYDGKAVTCEDFVSAMEEATGTDLRQFRNWYSQSGTPVVTVSMNYDERTRKCELTVKQKTPPTPRQPEKKPFVIPIKMSLYDRQGNRIPLIKDGVPAAPVQIADEESQSWLFENVPERPVPALLEGFSAPVKLEYPYTEEDLRILLMHAEDPVSRYDAVQSLIINYFYRNAENFERNLPFSEPKALIEAYRYILNSDMDRRFAAFVMTLPSINSVIENFRVVNLDAVFAVYRHLRDCLVIGLGDEISRLYGRSLQVYEERVRTPGSYAVTPEQMGERALAEFLLDFQARSLTLSGDAAGAAALVLHHYRISDNMTDTLAAMKTAVRYGLSSEAEILGDFEEKWSGNPLVFDNLFRAVAMAPRPDTLNRVRDLMRHKCFDIGNPNRVRALIGAFASGNPECFHAIDGSGYEFLTETVRQLNRTNGHVAARILTPMLALRRFDRKRCDMIKGCFEKLLGEPDLSDAVYELIDKSLRHL